MTVLRTAIDPNSRTTAIAITRKRQETYSCNPSVLRANVIPDLIGNPELFNPEAGFPLSRE